MKEMIQLSKVKQNMRKHKKIIQTLKKHKRQTQGQNGLYEVFLLTVPIDEVARWQYVKQFR